MGTLVTRVVNRLSARPAGTSSTWTYDGKVAADYALGGIPLISAADKQNPYGRKTAPYKKDQIDSTPIPGEQSMVFWWLRSQISFHGGTGIKFEEPALDPTLLYSDPLSAQSIPVRFQDGEGIDPWTTPGQVSLLPATTQNKSATGNVILEGAIDGSTDVYFQAEGNALARCVDGSSGAVTWGGANTIAALTNDGSNYYAADNVGIYKGTLAGGAGALAWNTGNSAVVVKWAKDRLVACIGTSIYELIGGAPPVLPTALFTPQIPSWTWTAIEEGPDCIWFAGYSGNIGKIYAATLAQNTGGVAIIGVPAEVATLPAGEQIYSLKLCDGSFLAIGTNKGVRIADVGTQGRLQWGPLQFTSSTPIRSLATYDRFLFAAGSNAMADGTSGLYRIDLGFQTQYQRFAYAKDLRAHVTGTVRSVKIFGASGRVVFSVDGNGSYLQHASNLESSGYLKTGNIRFHTQEDKLFKYVRLQTAQLTDGSIAITMNDSGGGSTSITTLGSTSTGGDVGLPTALGPAEWISLTFTLAYNTGDHTKGPTLYSYQLKALPGQKNQRLVILPIYLFDHEKDRKGNTVGYEGYAWDRLQELEALEEARDNIQFQNLAKDAEETRLVVIDDITFTQTDPPTNFDGFGGVAVVTLRTVT